MAFDNYADRVDTEPMRTLLSDPVASTLLVVDQTGGATMSEVARLTGKPLSTVQRAVDGLIRGGTLCRETPRGRLVFRADAPRGALREIVEWSLGRERASAIGRAAATQHASSSLEAPPTIRNARIRQAWPGAVASIVSSYHPTRIILFGSQARGDAGPESDVDLLVVFADEVDRRKRRAEILGLLRNMPFAKDVLVATTANVARPLIGSALADAIREGVTVYER